jgi:hypothetical protein
MIHTFDVLVISISLKRIVNAYIRRTILTFVIFHMKATCKFIGLNMPLITLENSGRSPHVDDRCLRGLLPPYIILSPDSNSLRLFEYEVLYRQYSGPKALHLHDRESREYRMEVKMGIEAI